MAEMNTLRIVLLGKSGSGKSSLGNTIFGDREPFKVNHWASSNSRDLWVTFTGEVLGRNVQLTDTPGFFDTNPGSSDHYRRIAELRPHAFLLVLKVERFTRHEQATVDDVEKCLSEEVLKYAVVVFTHGEELPAGAKVGDWVHHSEDLTSLVRKYGGRCHVFDNRYWNHSQDPYRNNQRHIRQLLDTTEEIVRVNGDKFFVPIPVSAPFATVEESSGSAYQPQKEMDALRIVLLGKTGAGKSSLGNTIFGDGHSFAVYHGADGSTQCRSVTRRVNGRDVKLIDTPDISDLDSSSTELHREILLCITECAPGPHAFLLVLKVEKFTEQEQAVVQLMLKKFSEEALKFTTVVFTRGDNLPEGMRIEEWAKRNKALKTLVQKCGGRCHVFDNKYWNNNKDEYRNNQHQVRQLLQTIDRTVEENGGRCYTNDMLQQVQQKTKSFFSWLFGF